MRLLPLCDLVKFTVMVIPVLKGKCRSHASLSTFSAEAPLTSPAPGSGSAVVGEGLPATSTPVEACVIFSANIGEMFEKFYCLGPDVLLDSTSSASGRSGVQSGGVFVSNASWGLTPCHPSSGGQFLLMWLEEYLRRLQEGVYVFQPPDLSEEDHSRPSRPDTSRPMMISTYPVKPLYNPLSAGTEGGGGGGGGGGETRRNLGASRSVTRNIEVLACPAYIPEKSDPAKRNFFWSYSVRLRSLSPGEQGYDPSVRSGTCQLESRHWVIHEPKGEHPDHQQGYTQSVDGEGVIGLYPLLRVGGGCDGGNAHQGSQW
jgi:uncharacterized protein affecting Mg2+/Co2+ transport